MHNWNQNPVFSFHFPIKSKNPNLYTLICDLQREFSLYPPLLRP